VKETWFFLFNDALIYAYEVVGSYVFKGEIPLGTSWIRDLIDTPGRVLFVNSIIANTNLPLPLSL